MNADTAIFLFLVTVTAATVMEMVALVIECEQDF